jgi:type IV secretion system protein VirD4
MHRVYAFGCRLILLAAFGVSFVALARVGFTYPAVGCLLLAYLAWKRYRRWNGSGWAYGTAKLGDMLTLVRAGFLTNRSGLIFGRAAFTARPTRGQALRFLFSPFVASSLAIRMVTAAFFRHGGNSLVRIHPTVHSAVFGSTGSGKGVGIVIPTLLSHLGSCVVIDPKSENFRITAEHRRRKGHTILRLDPFGLAGEGTDSLNPLDLIDDLAPDFPEQVDALADALIVISAHEKELHFPESAKIVLGSIVAYVCAVETDPESRNLHMVRHILSSRHRFNDAIEAMQKVTTHGGLIAAMGHKLTWFIEKELASVQTTIMRFTAWLDSPAMRAITRTSTFDPRKFKTCKVTLYLIIPARYLKTLAPLNRMWVSTLLRAMAGDVPDESKQVLFLLDEAGHLGHMQILEDAVTLMRGYGIRLMFFFQSIGQVTQVFGDRASGFLDNIGTQLFFGVNAYESAEAISKRCGDATVLVESLNNSKSFSRPSGGFSKEQSGSVSTSRSLNLSPMGRPLFRADEILRLSEEVGLLFHRNLPVIPIKLLKYYKEPEFRWGGSGNSFFPTWFFSGLLAGIALCFSLVLLAVSASLPAPQIYRQPSAPTTASSTVKVRRIEWNAPPPTSPVSPLQQPQRPRQPQYRYTPPPYPSSSNGGLNRPQQPNRGGWNR